MDQSEVAKTGLLYNVQALLVRSRQGSYGAGKSEKSRGFGTGFFKALNSLEIEHSGGLVGK